MPKLSYDAAVAQFGQAEVDGVIGRADNARARGVAAHAQITLLRQALVAARAMHSSSENISSGPGEVSVEEVVRAMGQDPYAKAWSQVHKLWLMNRGSGKRAMEFWDRLVKELDYFVREAEREIRPRRDRQRGRQSQQGEL